MNPVDILSAQYPICSSVGPVGINAEFHWALLTSKYSSRFPSFRDPRWAMFESPAIPSLGLFHDERRVSVLRIGTIRP
jgi:hypothetical protein